MVRLTTSLAVRERFGTSSRGKPTHRTPNASPSRQPWLASRSSCWNPLESVLYLRGPLIGTPVLRPNIQEGLS